MHGAALSKRFKSTESWTVGLTSSPSVRMSMPTSLAAGRSRRQHDHGRSLVLDHKWTGQRRHEIAGTDDSDAPPGGRCSQPVPFRQSKPCGKYSSGGAETGYEEPLGKAFCGIHDDHGNEDDGLLLLLDGQVAGRAGKDQAVLREEKEGHRGGWH